MKVGDIVTRRPITFNEKEGEGNTPVKAMKGRVVYVHPKGRYHTVEFQLRDGVLRESFLGVQE